MLHVKKKLMEKIYKIIWLLLEIAVATSPALCLCFEAILQHTNHRELINVMRESKFSCHSMDQLKYIISTRS